MQGVVSAFLITLDLRSVGHGRLLEIGKMVRTYSHTYTSTKLETEKKAAMTFES